MSDIMSKMFEGDAHELIPTDNEKIGPESKERFQGKITKIDAHGWGFISSKQVPFTRIFFHWSALTQDTLRFPALKVGNIVEFNTVEVPGKGTRATKLRVIVHD